MKLKSIIVLISIILITFLPLFQPITNDNQANYTDLKPISSSQIETELILYLNGQDKTSDPQITLQANQLLTIEVIYKELTSQEFISGATVDLNGAGISELLLEGSGTYYTTLNTAYLNFGANFLTIYAQKEGYEPQSIILLIQVVLIETELNLYLNDKDKTSNPQKTLHIDQLLTIEVIYKELTSQEFISGATVEMNGEDISELLVEGLESYSITLNTIDLDYGIHLLTIVAAKYGYEPQTISLLIRIVPLKPN